MSTSCLVILPLSFLPFPMCETMRKIAVNSVINWSFFIIYLLFFDISSDFIDSESGVTLCNQFTIRRPDTWHHSTRHRQLPTYWRYFGTKPISPAILEIMDTKHIGVTTLTIQGHVTSSVTWPFDPGMWRSISWYTSSWNVIQFCCLQ